MKPTAQRRRDRRDLLDTLLSRALRGRLTTTEAALLAESVREEQRVSDETRARLADSDRNIAKHREAAAEAIRELEQRAKQAEERAGRFEAAWQSARQRATEQRTLAQIRSSRLRSRAERIAALEQRLARMADNRTGWMQRAQDETHRADRYRTAWYACRRDRKADRAAMAADLPLIAVAPPPRAPEVITDRATIRNALDEQFDAVRRARP